MQNEEIQIIERLPSPDEYNRLRNSVGWHCIGHDRTEAALNNSLFSVCAVAKNKVIGFGRVVGDGLIYLYIQDIVVSPQYQRSGIGHKIMKNLMAYVDKNAPNKSGAFIGLMIAPGIAGFYSQYGFNFLPEDSSFMCLWRNGH